MSQSAESDAQFTKMGLNNKTQYPYPKYGPL